MDYNKARNRKTNYDRTIKRSIHELYSHPEKETKEAFEVSLNRTLVDIENIFLYLSKEQKEKYKRSSQFLLNNLKNRYQYFESLSEKGENKGVNVNKYLEALKKREERAVNIGLKTLEKEYSPEREELLNYFIDYIKEESPTKKLRENKSGLEKTLSIISGISIIGSLFVMSKAITGNLISQGNINPLSIGGALLFVLGVLGVALTIKK